MSRNEVTLVVGFILKIYSAYAKYRLGFDHPQGSGKPYTVSCPARWDMYIPYHMDRHLYICLISRGSHSHHPPYPNRVPQDIANDVQEIISGIDLLSMTTRMF
jgi:hypothetical protein